MLELNYKIHLILNSKYNFLIYFFLLFCIYYLDSFTLVDCTREVPISSFAPPRSVNFVGQNSTPIINLTSIQTADDVVRAFSIPDSTLRLHNIESLIEYRRMLNKDFFVNSSCYVENYIGGYFYKPGMVYMPSNNLYFHEHEFFQNSLTNRPIDNLYRDSLNRVNNILQTYLQ